MRLLVLIAAVLLFADATEASDLLRNWQPLAGESVALRQSKMRTLRNSVEISETTGCCD